MLELGHGDYDVDTPDLDLFAEIGPHSDDQPGVDRRSQGHTEPGFYGCECFGGGR